MAYEFKLPDLGEGIHEGEIKKWLVKEGDTVKSDQPIAELETDKAVVEMPSPKAGVVLKLFGKEGQMIKVGQILIVIGQAGETYSGAGAPSQPAPSHGQQKQAESQKPAEAPRQPSPPVRAPSPSTQEVRPAPSQALARATEAAPVAMARHEPITPVSIPPRHAIATPFVRKLAREMGVDIEMIVGSGEGGRVTEDDLKRAASGSTQLASGSGRGVPAGTASQPMQQAYSQPSYQAAREQEIKKIAVTADGEVERAPFKGMRKAIGEHMVASYKTAVHVTHMDEIDITEISKIREKQKAALEARGIKLTYLPFVVKALVTALREYRQFNASLDDEKGEIVYKKYYNIGIAVDTGDGLVVPVIRNADRKNIIEIAKEISDIADKSRNKKLTLEDMRGGSFTITNIGSIGGVFATPIINYPEVAILGLYRIEDRPVIRKGALAIRKMMNFTVTFDHRVIDGAQAGRFANVIKKHLEDPSLLLVAE